MTEEKKYPKLEELLPEGEHVLKVKPHPEFGDDKKPIEGSHKKGSTKWGNWYMYDTKVKDTWVTIFANDENKKFFDSGYVKANIVPKRMKGVEGDMYDANGKKLLKAFFNELSEVDRAILEKKKSAGDEEIPVEDIQF